MAHAPEVGAAARVWLEWNGAALLGHGRVTLLEAIDRHGSITQGAHAEGVSYRAAWRWIDRLNRQAGVPLVALATGGQHGGGARLTDAGRAAIAAHRLLEQRTAAMLARASREICALLAGRGPRRPPRGGATADLPGLISVGVVRSRFRTRAEVEPWGARAGIVVAPEFQEALDGIERSSHVWVLAWLHAADRSVLRARPRRFAPDAPLVGVFACRAPVRPNPLSLTACRVLGRDGTTLTVDGLDLVDGTPIVDLKPYNPGWDDISCATRERRVVPRALRDAQLFAVLERGLRAHLGDAAAAPDARLALAAVYLAVREFGVDPRDPALGVTVSRLDLAADAVSGLTGVTFGSGRLAFRPRPGPTRFDFRWGPRALALRARAGERAIAGP
ncbi:MAG: tRNA (N6-threonylcarbamoyladenosine(37)-N6)-methyltransferase TrmO, partial [Gemmatimonadales bacterium]|nr:tRNA (N6-threonylcarbamoyladenosine(37)-N6)-methyltransferase TrmO [Gemmatimonadales bacterium]